MRRIQEYKKAGKQSEESSSTLNGISFKNLAISLLIADHILAKKHALLSQQKLTQFFICRASFKLAAINDFC